MHTYEFPLKDGIAWSPHFYTLSYAKRYDHSNVTGLEADVVAKYQKFVIEMESPMWMWRKRELLLKRPISYGEQLSLKVVQLLCQSGNALVLDR